MSQLLTRSSIEILLFTLLVAIALMLIVARFTVFTATKGKSTWGSYLYDPIVAINLLASAQCFFAGSYSQYPTKIAALILYIFAVTLFLWSIRTTSTLRFAMSESPAELITHGAFQFSRHPFYSSYILTWAASSILYESIILWSTSIYLFAFYFYSATQEEKAMENGPHAAAYQVYQQEVGMFLPRITSWLRSLSTHS